MNLKKEWDAIDKADAVLDERKWKLAEALAKDGRSGAKLAKVVNRHERTVRKWIQVHREFSSARERAGLTFAQAMDRISGRTAESEIVRKADSNARKALRERPEEVIESLTPEDRQQVVRAALEADEKEATPSEERATKQARDFDKERLAYRQLDKALDALKARVYYFGDYPITDDERETASYIIQLAQSIRGESEIDAELEEMLRA